MFLNIHGRFIGAGQKRQQLRSLIKMSRRNDAVAAAQAKRDRRDEKRARAAKCAPAAEAAR
jgi:DNA-directed RNA polymerase delta subunit